MPCFLNLFLQIFAISLKNFLSLMEFSYGLHNQTSKFKNRVGYVGSKSLIKLGSFADPPYIGGTGDIKGKRNYSRNSTTNSLHPQFVSGFSDAESSFFITFNKSNKSLTGYYIQLSFQIGLHKKDMFLLELIKSYFGVGNILTRSKDLIIYRVTSVKDLAVIICHFNKYPLLTKKRADFELFQMAFNLISMREHLCTEGFTKILSLKASLNNGLPSDLATVFPNITPHLRPQIETTSIKDPQ